MQAPGDPVPSSALHRHQALVWYTDIHAGETPMCILTNKTPDAESREKDSWCGLLAFITCRCSQTHTAAGYRGQYRISFHTPPGHVEPEPSREAQA